ncbi:hypothetical protein F511_15031 [Dorcoceras hygrometricum]|uniref:Uncharacterized protein n=1 Tax=Dorcoceras hygrometricum TaxID=472368 RepID=A0A2Z7BYI3_9LAMI|nr:hypothetical protein F511_15031 [Dorcoceras hygrometricum]
MSWRDNVFTLTPQTSDRSPNLTSFLEAMRGKSYNAPELIKEDLLCFFGFSRKEVELAEDLEARMGKAEMLQFLEETEEAAVPPKKVRRASTPPIPTIEENPDPTQVIDIPEVSSTEKGSMKESGPGRVSPLNYFEDSLVVSPTTAVATKYLCHMAPVSPTTAVATKYLYHMAPDRDLDRLAGAFDSEAVSLFASQIASLEELKAIRDHEKKAAEAVQEALRAQLATECRAQATEEEALRRPKARAAEEAELMRYEVANAWALEKDEFLQSSKFERLCAKKSVAYFKSGFEGTVAQFRANGYSEEEHTTPFLDLKKALREMPEDDEGAEEEEEEEEASGDEGTPRTPLHCNCIFNFPL